MRVITNIDDKARLIWSIAHKLRGVYKPYQYGEVILPLTLLRRFDYIVNNKNYEVVDSNKRINRLTLQEKNYEIKDAERLDIYNTSGLCFEKIVSDKQNVYENFMEYLNGYSENVKEIISNFELEKHIKIMADKNILYSVLKEFVSEKVDLSTKAISNIEMGYIFEEIIRRFSESYKEDAGQHYTPAEVTELMVNLVFNTDRLVLASDISTKTIYDPACGTGGMLSVAKDYLKKHNKSAKVICYGQEINSQTSAIYKADLLIKGDVDSVVCEGNTITEDGFSEEKFSYILSNPPFGREWKNEKAFVLDEHKKGIDGRFIAGLPNISDSQMLFLQIALSKMDKNKSKVAIILNSAPLFSGDVKSGPCEIRKYIIENDLLEAIIALPNHIFYNTGIATYIWVLSNKKQVKRVGKVQLINANNLFVKRKKSLGNKRNDIPSEAIDNIARTYGYFKESDISKIVDNSDLGYKKIIVNIPKRYKNGDLILDENGRKQVDKNKKLAEKIPLGIDVDEYFEQEILSYDKEAWYDKEKVSVGYEIPFTQYFYEHIPPRDSNEVILEIKQLESELSDMLKEVFEG